MQMQMKNRHSFYALNKLQSAAKCLHKCYSNLGFFILSHIKVDLFRAIFSVVLILIFKQSKFE